MYGQGRAPGHKGLCLADGSSVLVSGLHGSLDGHRTGVGHSGETLAGERSTSRHTHKLIEMKPGRASKIRFVLRVCRGEL